MPTQTQAFPLPRNERYSLPVNYREFFAIASESCIIVAKAVFGFRVISRFRLGMLAVKGIVEPTGTELGVLFGSSDRVSGTSGGSRGSVSTAYHNKLTEKLKFQNYYRT
jgi:hypothetical protein